MISRKLIVAALAVALAGGFTAEASAATTLATTGTPVATQTTATAKTSPKVAIGGKRITNIGAKHHHVRMSRRAMKRIKIARALHGKRLVVSHGVKRTSSKHV